MQKGKQVKAITPPSFDEPITIENIGKFIKARRTQQGITTQDMALLCGVSAYTLNKIENGFEGVKLETLLMVMEALGMRMHMQEWSGA